MSVYFVLMIGDKIKKELEEREWSQEKLALESGVTQATISRVLNNKCYTRATLVKIGHAFGWDEEKLFQQIEHRKIPVFNAGAGGDIMFTDEGYPAGQASRFEYLPEYLVSSNTFGIVVRGDSMQPTLKDGSIVIIDPEKKVVNGNIVYYRNNDTGEKFIKRYHQTNGRTFLSSDNTAYEPIVPTGDYYIFRAVKIIIDI